MILYLLLLYFLNITQLFFKQKYMKIFNLNFILKQYDLLLLLVISTIILSSNLDQEDINDQLNENQEKLFEYFHELDDLLTIRDDIMNKINENQALLDNTKEFFQTTRENIAPDSDTYAAIIKLKYSIINYYYNLGFCDKLIFDQTERMRELRNQINRQS